ncbi:5'-3' exonuclease [Actinotalea sp. M2MS4P-6]|uniref:5'-3' exonuclease n=1 Tax=Actinotalea sp. M2MS4P-6 TaxID=2983762 RepID=UPI0021E4AFF3|nr:5'-3' exonuclease [Actinotalea sp. M2MS4P-6]MCV2394878.1 5'-3' exonuclease [Actinotalea sp. M2MS4P-6]
MATDRAPLLLLDSASMYFRAFYGVPDSVRAPDGSPVNAARGFLDAISRLVLARRPSRLVACWDDDWRPQFRVDAIASYKAHRVAADGGEEVPDLLVPQVDVIKDVLAAFGIARVGAAGAEADDVIGTLASRERSRPDGERLPVEIMTGDRDLFQLVDDTGPVRVLYPVKGGGEPLVVDQAHLAATYDVASGDAYADMATLRGDPSDGLPGVPGVGEKTAAAMIRRYGSLAGVLGALEAGDPGLTATQAGRLRGAADYLAVAPGVVRVLRDLPLGEVDDELPRTPVDPDGLVALAGRWGLESAVARLVDALAG